MANFNFLCEKLKSNQLNAFNIYKQYGMQLLEWNRITITIYASIMAAFAYMMTYLISSAMYAGEFNTRSIFGKTKDAIAISQNIGSIMGNISGYYVLRKVNDENRKKYFMMTYITATIPMLLYILDNPIIQILSSLISANFIVWIWGYIIFYIEGRYTTDIIILMIYAAIIIGGGVAKSIATFILLHGMNENWMVFICSVGGMVGCLIFGYLLSKLPKPTNDEIISRSERHFSTSEEQIKFIKKYKYGLAALSISYGFTVGYRKFRDYYALEMWTELLGANFDPSTYSITEISISITVTIAYCCIVCIKNNITAFYALLFIMMMGGMLIGIPTLVFDLSTMKYNTYAWTIIVGTGLYLAYIPPGVMLYDKLMSATNTNISIVSVVYISEAISQIMTLISILLKSYMFDGVGYVSYFIKLSYITSIAIVVSMLTALRVFKIHINNNVLPILI